VRGTFCIKKREVARAAANAWIPIIDRADPLAMLKSIVE
jgi:hypothetical protein